MGVVRRQTKCPEYFKHKGFQACGIMQRIQKENAGLDHLLVRNPPRSYRLLMLFVETFQSFLHSTRGCSSPTPSPDVGRFEGPALGLLTHAWLMHVVGNMPKPLPWVGFVSWHAFRPGSPWWDDTGGGKCTWLPSPCHSAPWRGPRLVKLESFKQARVQDGSKISCAGRWHASTDRACSYANPLLTNCPQVV